MSLVCVAANLFGDEMGNQLATSLKEMGERGYSKDQVKKQKDKWACLIKYGDHNPAD